MNNNNQTIYYVVDPADEFILYRGNLQDCEQVLEEQYGGVLIYQESQLTAEMKTSVWYHF
jgi:hypothetical protein